MAGPLTGIKVLELSRTLAGPFASMLLGDLGAEIIKVEQPGSGDETRNFVPPTWGDESCYYLSLNRNKRGMTLNLKTVEGREIVRRLVGESDVLVENFRTGTMEKFGLGYDLLKELNPRLVYCAVSGFGRTGPMKDDPAYDLLMQGFAGLMSVTGEPGGPPVKVGFSIADLATGLYAALGIMTALFQREKSGQGQMVETSLLESLISLQSYLAYGYFATGKASQKWGSAHPNMAPYQAFKAKDGYFIIAIPNDGLWRKMCDALDLQELKDHPKFAVNSARVAHREELINSLNGYTAQHNSQVIIEKLNKAGVPAGPINSIAEILNHPQVLHREMVQDVEHPTIGMMKLLGIPIKLSDTPGSIRLAPPTLGQHTSEILSGLGYSETEVNKLRELGVL
ncbi:MAG: CaiB/BaiF CoA transferase family protein [Desulfitobacteriaceae bacterium]